MYYKLQVQNDFTQIGVYFVLDVLEHFVLYKETPYKTNKQTTKSR